MAHTSDAFAADPAVMGGKLCLSGTRMPVAYVQELLDAGWSVDRICAGFELTNAQVEAVVAARGGEAHLVF